MGTVSIRMNKEEQKLFNEYAEMNNVGLSTLFKQTLKEKIEEDHDLKTIEEYEEDLANGNTEFYSHEEVRRMLAE